MTIQWGLAQNPTNALFMQGMQMGQNLVDRREAREQKNALLGMRQQEIDAKIGKDRLEAETEARLVELRTRAVSGDQTALQELAARDPATFKEYQQTGRTALAEAAFDIIQTPDQAQQAAKWDSYAQRFNRPDLVGKFTPQLLNEVVAQGGLQQEFQKFQQPDYVPVGEGGLAGFRFGQPLQQDGQPQNFWGATPPPPPAGFVLDEGGPASAPGGFRP